MSQTLGNSLFTFLHLLTQNVNLMAGAAVTSCENEKKGTTVTETLALIVILSPKVTSLTSYSKGK